MWDIIEGILEIIGLPGGRRVTVADRYAMKRKVRELRRKERAARDERPGIGADASVAGDHRETH
jgi:hypothetical protein